MSTAAYKFYDGSYGAAVGQPTDSDAAQRSGLELGVIVRGHDASSNAYGEAEFAYVKFTGTVAAGDFVFFDIQGKTCVQTATSATKGFGGVSMAAQSNGTFGWVMIRGTHDTANVLTGTTVQIGPNYGSAVTAGRVTSAVTANYILDGVAVKASGASNVGTLYLYWPVCSGR